MAANKEAVGIVLDVGPSMNQAAVGETTALQTAIDCIQMILQRKMFAESKDEIVLILFGTPDTDNPLADGESYENVSIARPLGVADFDLLQYVQNDIHSSDIAADFIDALVVALDHVVNGIQGKRGFAHKRLILFSDLGGEFGDDQIEKIIAGMKNTGTELNIIGPDFEDDEDDDNDADDAAGDGGGKAKTPQQRAGEALVKHMLEEVEGEVYSFSEALPALSFFQARQVRPTAWKCSLQIGVMAIPICAYIKVKDFRLKQSWKKVYAKDTEAEVGTLRTHHMDDEEETEVEKEDMVEGHRYGKTLVPMSEDDKENMKYITEKCFKVLGFTKAENIKRHHYMGDGVMTVVGEKGDDSACVAISALANALYETSMVAIVRRVYAAKNAPKLGFLSPHIKTDYECLYWTELPFMEDLRQFTFGSLPVREDVTANKKYIPSAEQLLAVDDLITTMDLSQAGDENEEGKRTEILKPKFTFNPHFQHLYQCLQHRVSNPDDPLPELSPLVANYLKPCEEVKVQCAKSVEKLSNLFKLEVVAKKKEQQTGENMFKENGTEEAGPAAKKPRLDDDLEGGIADIARAKITEVGSVTPVEDFKSLIADDVDMERVCKQMDKRIYEIVMDSFGAQFYGKAMDCVKALRETCIKKKQAKLYNSFLTEFKETLISKGRRDFWDVIVTEKTGLIDDSECPESDITKERAEAFLKGEEIKEAEEEDTPQAEDADDLVAMMS